MGLGEALAGFYGKIENAFYSVVDGLGEKGIPLHKIVDALEDKGIPSFPVFCAIVLAVVVALLWIFVLAPAALTVQLSLLDDSSNSLNNVTVQITDSQGNVLFGPETINSGTPIELKGAKIGDSVNVSATKQGFDSAEEELSLEDLSNSLTIVLGAVGKEIIGELLLKDSLTGDPVKNASVLAEWDSGQVSAYSDESGKVELAGVPAGKDVTLTINAEDYEQQTAAAKFSENETKSISLSPKTASLEGKAKLVMHVYEEGTQNLVDEAEIEIYNKQTETRIYSIIADSGTYAFDLDKGTSIKWIVKKEGFIQYDSAGLGESLTVRKDEEKIDVFLEKGGTKVNVIVSSKQTKMVLSNASVVLYNSFAEQLGEKATGFAGNAEFGSLNPYNTYFVSAIADGYLPAVQEFSPQQLTEARLELETLNSLNSASLQVFTSDSSSNPVAGAAISFFEKKESKEIPLGIPNSESDLTGYLSLTVPIGKTVLVKAVKETLEGQASLEIKPGSNKADILMEAPISIVTLNLKDSAGNAITDAELSVESLSGSILFEGTAEDGNITFDALGNKNILVKVQTSDGKSFEEEINIEGVDEKDFIVGAKQAAGPKPDIKFLGAFDAAGNELEGLVKGEEAFLVFETVWPEGDYLGGIHVRIGADSVKSAESQQIGITGFSADTRYFFYGRTFNKLPEPGNEAIDFQNSGSAGKMSKFIEMYFNNPGGTKIVKVIVRARDTAFGETELHYRAWSSADGTFNRNPEDAVLGTSEFSSDRTALYAETSVEKIKIFDSLPKCEEGLCAAFRFLDSGESESKPEDFKAIKGNLYALEVSIKPKEDATLIAQASTSKESPAISFTGIEEEHFNGFPDSDTVETSMELAGIAAEKGVEKKVRIYFKALEEANTFLKLRLVSEQGALNKDFYFDVFEEKALNVAIDPQVIQMGEDFSVTVQSPEGNAVTNARLAFKSADGKELKAILGANTKGKGFNGIYTIKNNFELGEVLLQVNAFGFKQFEKVLQISRANILVVQPEIKIAIEKDSKAGMLEIEIKNTSGEDVSEIVAEIIEPKGFPPEMELSIDQVYAIPAHQSRKVRVNAAYYGGKEREHAEADLVLSGKLGVKFSATAKSRIIADYNPELDADCLEFDQTELQTTIVSDIGGNGYSLVAANYSNYNNPYTNADYYSQPTQSQNYYNSPYYRLSQTNPSQYSSYSQQYIDSGYSSNQVTLKAKNNCSIALHLLPEVIGESLQEFDIAAEPLDLEPNTEGSAKIVVTNKLARAGLRESFDFTVLYKSDSLSKSVPLKVNLMSPSFALQATDVIHIFLSQQLIPTMSYAQNKAETAYPLFIRNIGETDITNLSIQRSSGYLPGVDLKIGDMRQSIYSVAVLRRGQTLVPPPVIFASSDVQKSGTMREMLTIQGHINGRPYILKSINVFIHVSAPSCLKVTPKILPAIEEEEAGSGATSRKISVLNSCMENVRLVDVEPKAIANNALALMPLSGATYIPAGARADFQLILSKRQEVNTTSSLTLFGVLMQSGKIISSEPVELTLKLGRAATETNVASQEFEIKYCDAAGEEEKAVVRFPLIASGSSPDCTAAYCDSEQLAGFLAEKIDKKILEAENQITLKNEEALGMGCEATPLGGYCSFDVLGVKTEQFAVYFQNDVLSTELFKNTISSDRFARIKGYAVQELVGSAYNFAGMGYGRQLLIGQFRGCGKYYVRIYGATEVANMKLQRDRETIGVEIVEKTPSTGECANKVYNFLNFLPKDYGLTYSNRKSAWIGTSDSAKTELNDAAKAIAKTLFNDEKRFVKGSQTNVLLVDSGKVDGLVEISMRETGLPDAPRTIRATVSETVLEQLKAVEGKPSELADEVSSAISSMSSSSVAENSCISRDLDMIRFFSGKEAIGQIAIQVEGNKEKGELRLKVDKEMCTDFNVLGKLPQRVSVKIKETEPILGINWPPVIKEKGSEQIVSPADAKKLVEVKDRKGPKQFTAEYRLCATATKEFSSVLRSGSSISVIAEDMDKIYLKRVEKQFELKACALHPVDFVAVGVEKTVAVKNKEKKEYYALVSWKDAPDTETLARVQEIMVSDPDMSKLLKGHYLYSNASGATIASTAWGTAEMQKKKANAAYQYGGACFGVHLASDFVTGLFTGGFGWVSGTLSAGIDCGLPLAFGLYEIYGKDMPAISKIIDNSWGYISKGAKEALQFIGLIGKDQTTGAEYVNTKEAQDMFGTGTAVTLGRNAYPLAKEGITGFMNKLKSFIIESTGPQTDPSFGKQPIIDKYDEIQSLGTLKKPYNDTIKSTGNDIVELNGKLIPDVDKQIGNIDTLLAKPNISTNELIKLQNQRQVLVGQRQLLVGQRQTLQTQLNAAKAEIGKITMQQDALKKEAGNMIDELKKNVETKAGTIKKTVEDYNPKNSDDLMKIAANNKEAADELGKINKNNYSQARSALKKIANPNDPAKFQSDYKTIFKDKIKPGAGPITPTKGFLSEAAIKRLGKFGSFARGVGIGVFANWVGYKVYNNAVKSMAFEKKINFNDDAKFVKNASHKLTITKNEKGEATWNLGVISKDSEIPKDAVWMDDKYCNGEYNRLLEEKGAEKKEEKPAEENK